MMKSSQNSSLEGNYLTKKGQQQRIPKKRALSLSPVPKQSPACVPIKDNVLLQGKCQSLPQSPVISPTSFPRKGNGLLRGKCQSLPQSTESIPRSQNQLNRVSATNVGLSVDRPKYEQNALTTSNDGREILPHTVMVKLMRNINTKKREFIKMRKSFLAQQNALLENYAQLKEMENRAGITSQDLGEIRILSLKGWPAYDLLLIVRDDFEMPFNFGINSCLGSQIFAQMNAQLTPISDEVLMMCEELLDRRIYLLNSMRANNRPDRGIHLSILEWKTKNQEFDRESEELNRMVMGTVENLRAKIKDSLELVKVSWRDRESLIKKLDKVEKDNLLLQHKLEELSKQEVVEKINAKETHNAPAQGLHEELAKERAECEALKESVMTGQNMLNVARGRVALLERQLREAKTDLEAIRKKYKDLEQLYRHREATYGTRSKKLFELSKSGEMTIEALSRQRDALEIRVKELHEQAQNAEQAAATHVAEERARVESLQAKVATQLAMQEKMREAAETRVAELESKNKELEKQIVSLREHSVQLVELERKCCLEYVPSKQSEPSKREAEIWQELQNTRVALSHVEEELRQSRADKDNFLESISKIAKEEADEGQERMATELLDKEQKITKLQLKIAEKEENEKILKENLTWYKKELASLRLEVRRLQNYECFQKEVTYQDLQNELLDVHMEVEMLSRERDKLASTAASRALMLERHERSADMFTQIIRARTDLEGLLTDQGKDTGSEAYVAEISKSLSSVCTSSAATWSALRAERARILRLESVVVAQNTQLKRENCMRTQLEQRHAILEREILRAQSERTTHSKPSLKS